jgi:hypothetical protein
LVRRAPWGIEWAVRSEEAPRRALFVCEISSVHGTLSVF